MIDLPLAFLMGLFGSLHCALMCGPIMLGMPFQNRKMFGATIHFLAYQIGRILTYTLLGFLVGCVGNTIKLFSNQQSLSLTVGILLILFTLLQFMPKYVSFFVAMQSRLITPISELMGRIFKLPFWGFFAGMLNGIIPCGMVYLALATAIANGNWAGGATFMFLFGLGTTPLMMLVSLGGIFLKKHFSFSSQKLIPWFTLLVGAMLILRAANLGIPYLSPAPMGLYGQAVDCK